MTLTARRKIQINGVVQGVGFRPFVYRVATRFEVGGYVLNSSDGVVIEAEATERALDSFVEAVKLELPPLARIDALTVSIIEPVGEKHFKIRQSVPAPGRFVLVPPDLGVCDECRHDFTNEGNRRYEYPFTNCTNCGPRYTIIRDIPYDRRKTTMDGFKMCAACQLEYEDPANRRFHAEPNACPDCGPGLALLSSEEMGSGTVPQFDAVSAIALERTRTLLAGGSIIAIKGVGGFHLACSASDDQTVALLRERKRRRAKAFAIMVRDLQAAERLCTLSAADRELISSRQRPIVLLPRRPEAAVSAHLAPGNPNLDVMLPYTPLHHLLFKGSSYEALVMTSGNLSEEPIVSSNAEVWPRLKELADYFLLHNREIQTPVDDSVLQSFEGREYPIGETMALKLDIDRGARFPLRFRVPGWSKTFSVQVNGATVNAAAIPGEWATVDREWKPGDRVEVRIPMHFRWEAVDAQHPNRAAIVRGPVVMPLEFRYLEPLLKVPKSDDELNTMLTPDTGTEVIHTLPSGGGAYRLRGSDGRSLMAMVRPFYQYTEDYPYLMYLDRDAWPVKLW